MDFSGRVVVVTGGSSGIGRAAVDRFASEGANVIIASRDADEAEAAAALAPGNVISIPVDVSDRRQVEKMISETVEKFGQIDVLCNNAGFGFTGNVTEVEEDDWDRLFAVNVKGMYLCARFAIPHLAQSKGGNIVNLTSYTATAAIGNRAAYVASKGAISALTRAMAIDHASSGIRVNAVAPGTVDTPYFSQMISQSEDPEGLRTSLGERSLLGRMARPEEIASAVAWVASDDASFVTGSVLTVDGGSSIWGRN